MNWRMPAKMRAAREFRSRARSTLASALSKVSSSSPGNGEKPLAETAESGRTIIDTGSDGCGSTGGGGVEVWSAAGFGMFTALPAIAGFAAAIDFCGIGLGGKFDDVAVFAGDRSAGGVVFNACSSIGWAVSAAADGVGSVLPLLHAAGSEGDFSGFVND
jgi:hypothetical protein